MWIFQSVFLDGRGLLSSSYKLLCSDWLTSFYAQQHSLNVCQLVIASTSVHYMIAKPIHHAELSSTGLQAVSCRNYNISMWTVLTGVHFTQMMAKCSLLRIFKWPVLMLVFSRCGIT